jgi:hypothetical protein
MIQLGGKLTTMAKVLAEKDGSDLDDVLAELEDEKARFNAAGFKHPAELEEDKVANSAGGMPGGQAGTQPTSGDALAPEGASAATLQQVAAEQAAQNAGLNGAQVTALIAVIQSVADKIVTEEAAVEIIAAAFPSIPKEQVIKIMKGAIGTPAPKESATPTIVKKTA